MGNAAATPWIEYTDGPISPQFGEWCLWSVIIRGKRNQSCGILFEHKGEAWIALSGLSDMPLEKIELPIFWARVHHPPVHNLPNKSLNRTTQP